MSTQPASKALASGPAGSEKYNCGVNPSFWFRHAWFPGLLFLSLVLIFELTDLDLWCSDLFYDFRMGKFYWRETWWANQLLHEGGRYAVAALVASSLVLLIWSCLKRKSRWVNWQRALLFFLLSVAIGPGTIGIVKAVSNKHYPVHIERYGGPVPYRKLFEGTPPGFKRSKGFPAAHASAGYALIGSYFIFRERRRWKGSLGLALGLAVGTLFAFGQQARGVHFASHNVWSLAICWYGSLILYGYAFRFRLDGPLFEHPVRWPFSAFPCPKGLETRKDPETLSEPPRASTIAPYCSEAKSPAGNRHDRLSSR
jgi:membrane-associated PAP2 superfamily phosphatase